MKVKPRRFVEKLKAEMFDSTLRWLVESESVEGESHLVDLQEWRCTCTDYVVRKESLFRATKDRKLCACKHITKAMNEFSYLMLEKMIEYAVSQELKAKEMANKNKKETNVE